jgi:hypothetical protein
MMLAALPARQALGSDGFTDLLTGSLRTRPELVCDDSQVGTFDHFPLMARPVAHKLPACRRLAFHGLLSPDLEPEIPFVGENPIDGGLAPPFAPGSRHTLPVQPVQHGGYPDTFGGPLEDPADHLCLVLVHADFATEQDGAPIGVLAPGRVEHGDLGYLISVHCDDREWARRAKEILEATSGRDVVSTSESAPDYRP